MKYTSGTVVPSIVPLTEVSLFGDDVTSFDPNIRDEQQAEAQPENPTTPDKDAAEQNDEREKDEREKENSEEDRSDAESEHFYRQVQSFDFPIDANPKALYGIAGEATRLICGGTENKPEAVLAQFLCIVGNAIGRAPYKMQDKEHGTNINVAVVGPTAGGAKGSSLDAVKRLFKAAYPNYCSEKFSGGHNSSEAILEEIRDEVCGIDPESGEPNTVKEPEEPDKRLMIVEEELTRIFNVSSRGGSNISETCREFYDRPDMVSAKSRKSRLTSTDPHVSIIGHVTPEALRSSLKSVEVFNGFANRFIYVASKRTRPVPRPPMVDWTTGRPAEIVKRLQEVGKAFHPSKDSSECSPVEFDFTEEAAEKWDEIYYRLEDAYTGKSGLHGAIVARWKPAILRLAIIYAALDMDSTEKGFAIDVCHVEAAEALWRYAADSAVWAFGLNSGNPKADKILKHLARVGEADKTLIRLDCFDNHIATADLDEALAFLKGCGYANMRKEGKRQIWFKI